jgi:hypothetical protein
MKTMQLAVVLGMVMLLGPGRTAAQQREVTALAIACAVGDQETLESPCLEAALAAQAVQGLIGLAAGGGSELPGSSSTLGKRFGGAPRFALSAGLTLVNGDVPSVLAPSGGVAGSKGTFVPALQITGAAGLFQGFSPAPTVGGILALDVLASFSYVGSLDRLGLDDPSTGFGLGARVGIVRESFTLPAVTFSATRRWMGDASLSNSDGSTADVDVTATALRFTVGKELLAFGLLGGVGWDRYSGSVDVEVRPAGPSGPTGSARTSSLDTDRMLFFGGIGYTFLVAQIGVEGGWATGYGSPPDRDSGGFDPDGGSFFGRLAFRLTL